MDRRQRTTWGLADSQVLSRKIDLLLDVVRRDDGQGFEYKDLESSLAQKGIKLSRTRWQNIKSGDSPSAQPKDVLVAIAEFFGVNASYLLETEGELPERIKSELELLRSMRRARVKDFATRTLADIDTETLKAITELIDESLER